MSEEHTPAATILFVEDEPLIRVDLAEYLRECGYRVHEASNAEEAVQLLEAKYAIDLVFSDINLPGEMNGIELAAWIKAQRPSVKIILTTGGVSPAPPNQLGPILRKPYTARDMEARIHATIEATSTGAESGSA